MYITNVNMPTNMTSKKKKSQIFKSEIMKLTAYLKQGNDIGAYFPLSSS